MKDRVGLGWRPELAAGILSNLDRIDVVEVIADDYFEAPKRIRRSLTTLSAQVPVVLHGVSLGMASCSRVEMRRLDRMARLVGEVQPPVWSEHLAFVRAGGVEIGHLTAAPRTEESVKATIRNLDVARQIVGAAPQVENIATLIEPPGSTLAEPEWLSRIVLGSGCDLLLDLHNVYANALNFGARDPLAFLLQLPLEKVATIHLAGGKWIGPTASPRLLDDHLHDVPDPVYTLLEEVGARTSQPLTVILERDGAYPSIEGLIAQLGRAREALARGRGKCRSIS
jgi:uncharacterized protein (UPF0276 family)